MKITVILTVLFLLVFPLIANASDDELVVTCKKEGSEMYNFTFRKALAHKEFCGPMEKPRHGHDMGSEVIGAQGIEGLVSIRRYGVQIIKGKDFTEKEIAEKLGPIIAKYLKVKKVTIIYK